MRYFLLALLFAVNVFAAGLTTFGNFAQTNVSQTWTQAQSLSAGLTVSGTFTTQTPITLNSGQIVFPATQVPSSNANTFDDYEEGVVSLVFDLTSGSLTYLNQNCSYTKYGNTVTVNCWMRINTKSSPVNTSMTLSNLPFAATATEYRPVAFMRTFNTTITGQVCAYVAASQTALQLLACNNGTATALSAATFLSGSNSEVDFTFTYTASQ